MCPRCLRQHYVSVIVALRERFYELDRTMNSHLRDAGTPAQRAAEAALQAFTKEREAENAYRHFQNKYKKRKDKGWRNMGKMREEKHDLKEALAAEQARDAERKAELLKVRLCGNQPVYAIDQASRRWRGNTRGFCMNAP